MSDQVRPLWCSWPFPPPPTRAGMVLGTLIIVTAVANLPLAMANVALPADL